MAATLTNIEANFCPILTPVLVTMTTDLAASTPKAVIDFAFTSTGPTNGQYVLLAFGDANVYLYFATTPALANEFPVYVSGTLAAHVAVVAESMRNCYDLSSRFKIEIVSSTTIRLTDLAVAALDVSNLFTNLSNVTISVTDGQGAFSQPNLLLFAAVFSADDDTELFRIQAPYKTDLTTQFSISEAFADMQPEAIPDAKLADSSVSTNLADAHIKPFYLRFCDRFGSPAILSKMTKSATYYAVLAAANIEQGRAVDFMDAVLPTLTHVDLHADFLKNITPKQPEFWFVLNKTLTVSVRLSAFVTYADGTTNTFLVGSAFTPVVNKIYYFPIGYRQTGLHLVAASVPVSIQYRLINAATSAIYSTRDYHICDLKSTKINYFLIENGMGGLESLYMQGETTRRPMVDRTTVQKESTEAIRNITENTEAITAYMFQTQMLQMPISHAPLYRNLMTKKVWLANNGTLIPIVVTTAELEENPNKEYFNMRLEYEYARKEFVF
jgi:hypothetical protein